MEAARVGASVLASAASTSGVPAGVSGIPASAASGDSSASLSPGYSLARALDARIYQFEFEPSTHKDKERTPYRLQGSRVFDKPDILRERQKLRSSTRLRSAIMQFWTTLGLRVEDRMDEETYRHVHLRCSRALAPELDESEAAAAAAEDWHEDSGRQPTISFEDFCVGLSGVADMWTDTVDELAYVVFINKLYRRITRMSSSMYRKSTQPLPRSRT